MPADLKTKLAQLKELHELGLMTDADFVEQKRAALNAFMGSPTAEVASAANSLGGPTRVGPSAAAGGATPPLAGETRADPLSGLPARLGSYAVLDIIGAGGMGTVVRARHEEEGWAEHQGGDVAIKLIHPRIASSADFRKRFFTEAALGKRIQHPGLATVYDVVSEGPWLGTILELVEGKELSTWVRPGGRSVAEVVPLLTPLADALDHLHTNGIVHRDLKPANVKVRPDGRPVLLDLGIAKDLSKKGRGHTQTMTSMGTCAWMAPEQVDSRSVTAAADVYAFGLVVYALLAGRLPWDVGASPARIIANKLNGDLVDLSTAAPHVATAVSTVVMEALAVSASARPTRCGLLLTSVVGQETAAQRAREAAQQRAEAARRHKAEQARLRGVAMGLAADAASVGAQLKIPEVLSEGWLERARETVQQKVADRQATARREAEAEAARRQKAEQARLRGAAMGLAADAASVGAQLKLPEVLSEGWLEKARETVQQKVADRQARARREAEESAQRAEAEAVAEQARLRRGAMALATDAASVGAQLKIPEVLSEGWLAKAREMVQQKVADRQAAEREAAARRDAEAAERARALEEKAEREEAQRLAAVAEDARQLAADARQALDELEQMRLKSEARELAAEAARVGARLKIPERLSAGWLEKARATVAAEVARRAAQTAEPSPEPSPGAVASSALSPHDDLIQGPWSREAMQQLQVRKQALREASLYGRLNLRAGTVSGGFVHGGHHIEVRYTQKLSELWYVLLAFFTAGLGNLLLVLVWRPYAVSVCIDGETVLEEGFRTRRLQFCVPCKGESLRFVSPRWLGFNSDLPLDVVSDGTHLGRLHLMRAPCT